MSRMRCSTICGCELRRNTRWPDQVPGIGWKQGTELDWLRQLVTYWAHEFDWRAWEQRLNALNHFTWEGVHFVHRRAGSGRGVPLILHARLAQRFPRLRGHAADARGFPTWSFPSLPGYGFSPRPLEVGINYRYVSERWHRLMTAFGYSPLCCGGAVTSAPG